MAKKERIKYFFVGPGILWELLFTIFHEEVGAVNTVLRVMGALNLPAWFSDPWLARLAISIVDVWQWTPFCFLVILAGLQSQPVTVIIAGVEHTQVIQFWFVATRILAAILPPAILVLAVQRCIVRGLTFGAIKG